MMCICACGGRIDQGVHPYGPINVCEIQEVCEVITIAQVNEATGRNFVSSGSSATPSNPIGESTCAFEAPQSAPGKSPPTLRIDFECPQNIANAQKNLNGMLANGGTFVDGVGDQAVWQTFTPDFGPDFAGQLLVISGAATFEVIIEQDVAVDVETSKKIARDVIANL
ncbi:MAG: hypothetical protein ABI183_15730 [Polyangiaceae bacterium]